MDKARLAEFAAELPVIREAPRDTGLIKLLVYRPAVGQRVVVEEATFDTDLGVLGDIWRTKGSSSTPDGRSDPRAQVTVTSWRGMSAVARPGDIPLAGDQIYADLDLSFDNLPAGTLLYLGTAVLEVSDKPHKGCEKFMSRFGKEALRFVNTGEGGRRRLRGINCIVRVGGTARVGDPIGVQRPADGGDRQVSLAATSSTSNPSASSI